MSAHQVLVVDDSIFMRKIITDLIEEDPRFQVAGTARNGMEAIEKAKQLRPDVITMDVEMPVMNGLDALRAIMKENPTPVIMLSSLTAEGALETIEALEWGAFDFLQKPSGSISFDLFKLKSRLHEKLALAADYSARIRLAKPVTPAKPVLTKPTIAKTGVTTTAFSHLVAIGTSTGGPRALNQVLAALPAHFPAPILIVQHMPPNFTRSLANRLDSVSHLRVLEAEEGMILEKGTAYVAKGGNHMGVSKSGGVYRLHLNQSEPVNGHRPSVDALFESLVPFNELKRHIVLMTGMGSDGAKGMLALKKAGAVSAIAEAKETCVVYGMPRAAVMLEGTTHILPLPEIPGKLVQLVEV